MATQSPSRLLSPSLGSLRLLPDINSRKGQCGIARSFAQGLSQRNVGDIHISFQNRLSVMFRNNRPGFACAVDMAAGRSGEPENTRFRQLMDKARELWDSSPEPVQRFPWIRALENFIQLVLDLTLAVVKILCVPLLAVTSLSEMSYCAHERKLKLVPFPLIIGFALSGVLKETVLEQSPVIKDAKVPWHLIAIAIFFTLIKLPGPYYPYWGRIVIPHVANGALLRTLWSAYVWFRRSPKASSLNPK